MKKSESNGLLNNNDDIFYSQIPEHESMINNWM